MIEFHPVANIFPLMSDEDTQSLATDIAAHGLREPVWLHRDGRIVDGRNRYRACVLADVVPPYRSFEGTDEQLLAWVLSLNLERRHLTDGQRAMIAANVAQYRNGVHASQNCEGQDRVKLAAQFQVAPRALDQARVVATKGEAGLSDLVGRAQLPLTTAEAVARMTPEEQREVIAAVDPKLAAKVVADRRKANTHVGQNTGENDWYTPQPYIAAARKAMGGIDLDPASSRLANEGTKDQPGVRADEFYDIETDGLTQEWRGRVWMNPPYSQPEIGMFASKLVAEYHAGRVTQACVLVNNATETAWFQEMAGPGVASAICFPKSRVRFWYPGRQSAPLQGQAVLFIGPGRDLFVEAFRTFGFIGGVL